MCRLPDGCMPEKTRALMVGGFEGVIFILSDFEITVEKLVYGGEGLGRLEGRAVLAPFVLPGERARAGAGCFREARPGAGRIAGSAGRRAGAGGAAVPVFHALRRLPLSACAV